MLLALSTSAFAQGQATAGADLKSQGDAALDTEATSAEDRDIVVTGTNISGVKAVGSEAIVLNRQQVLATGKSSVADVVRTLPQLQNLGLDPSNSGSGGNSTQGGNTVRGNSLNIRGIGQGATLTLVDGHRITPSGTAGAFTEANQVPLAAIERIEVITDGASAIYGSDAISGVVNYILRKDFQGVELNGRYTFGAYGNDEYALSGVAGAHWSAGLGDGNVILTYEYSRRLPYVRGVNDRLRQDQRNFGGIDGRIDDNGATPALAGNIRAPIQSFVPFPPFLIPGPRNPSFPQGGSNNYYALPDNPTGRPLTVADLRANQANVVDRSDYEDFLGEQTKHQVALFFNQDLGDSIQIYDELFYTHSDQVTRTFVSQNASANVIVNVPARLSNGQPNPNYIAGVPGLAPGADIPVQLNLLERVLPNGPRFVNENPDESINNTIGFRVKMSDNWRGEVYYTYGQNKSCGICYLGNFINADNNDIRGVSALQASVNSGLINPFSTAPFTQAQLAAILGTNSQYSQNYSHDVVAKVDGSLFDLPGGALKVALGGEYYYGIQKLQNAASRGPQNLFVPDANARTIRKQWAAFGEVYVPLVSDEMDVPLVQDFTVSGALRYDHYSDFGSTTNPRISATWELNDDLKLRGSWGTAFRAPGLPELNAGVFSLGLGSIQTVPLGVAGIPIIPGSAIPGVNNGSSNALIIIGNSPRLKAEKGKTWQIGADFTPTFLPGFRASATYYSISYTDKIYGGLNAFGFLANAQNRAIYSDFIVPINNPATCSNGNPSSYDPALVEYADFLYSANLGFDPRNACSINVVLDQRVTSAASTKQDGLDFSASYSFDTNVGGFTLTGSVTKILNNTEILGPAAPVNSALDTIGDPISLRARGSLNYVRGVFFSSLFVNHIGKYRNDLPITIQGVQQPQADIPSWTTFDLNLGVAFPDGGRWSFMRNTRLSATVTNLFNKAPPIVFSTLYGSSSIDLQAHNAYGRYFQLQLSKAF
jgi:iron complex outermembrane receptor protein